jgi:undecaprenyl-diphosphatase
MADEVLKPDDENATDKAAPPPEQKRRRVRETRRLLRAEVFYAAGLAAFAVLAVLAHTYAYFAIDLRLARAVQSIDFPGWAEFMRIVSLAGNRWTPHAITVVTALVFLAWGRRSEGFGLVLSAGGGSTINRMFKILIARPRPSAELVGFSYRDEALSFPSGHVTFYVCYFGFLFFVAYALLPRGSNVRRAALVATALPVLIIGLSRIYLRAHWPSDVLGAYLLSGVWLAFSLAIYRRWKRRATFHPEETAVGSDK